MPVSTTPVTPLPWMPLAVPPEMLKSWSEVLLASVTTSPLPEAVSVAAPAPSEMVLP